MELSAELMALLENHREEIESLELTYRNGGTVTGSIRKFRPRPFKLVIRKSIKKEGESSRHRAVPGHLTGIVLSLKNGQVIPYS